MSHDGTTPQDASLPKKNPVPLTVDMVKNMIKYNRFTVSTPTKGRIGTHFRLLQNVYDEKNVRLIGFYFCRKCEEVLYYISKAGTQPLERHVRRCEANGSELQFYRCTLFLFRLNIT